ncbi:MAG: TrbI/VirB10 family protein [Rubrivivax sp.]
MSESATLPPKADPEAMALRAPPRPVVRLNRRMLAVIAGALAAVVLGATLWSLQPAKRDRNPATELYNVDRVAKAESLDQLPKDYAGVAPRPTLPPGMPQLGDLGPAIVKAQQPMETRVPGGGVDPAHAARLAAEEAARSGVFFRATGGSAAGAKPAQAAPAGEARSSQPFDALAGALTPAAAAQPPDPTAVQNRQDQKETFVVKAGDAATRNTASLQLPASPYQVMAGTVIPAALVTGIKSDLPGDVIATVTEPVYDTATGRHVLIPQGSRLTGRYNSQVGYGQSRVQVVWNRVILPDTSSLQLGNLVGTDPAGYAGLEDGVDWHWDRIFAGAALTTLLGVGAELAAPENRQDGNRVIIAGRQSVQDSVNQVGQEMTRRNLNIQPTLTERPGLPVRVIVNRDLVLRPYQPLFFQRGSSQ